MGDVASTLMRSSTMTLDQFASFFTFNGNAYGLTGLNQTLRGKSEEIDGSFTGLVQQAYKSNGVVFACMLARLRLFSEARFQFREYRKGLLGDLFGTADLAVLEHPWPGGTTGDLLARAIQDADLAGNFFCRREGDRIRRMRPDWVTIVLGSESDADDAAVALDAELLGYLYYPGGRYSGHKPEALLREEVAHFAPIPDPIANFRGMSWLTPVIREIQADSTMTVFRDLYLTNGASPNMVVSLDKEVARQEYKDWIEAFKAGEPKGWDRYKTLYLGAGAKVEVVGNNLQEIDFKAVQGAGEPLALDTPIPTPGGWTTMGEIEPGDQVFGRDGRPATVTGASPVHVGRDCYRVTFSDKTSIVADGGHLWLAMDRNTNDRAELTYTTDELRALIDGWHQRGITQAHRIGIPAGAPVQLGARDLLLDPYVLGVWLGDGATAGAAISGAWSDLDIIAQEIERRGYTVTRWATSPDKASVIGLPGGVLAALDALGVLGGKCIPADYLRASHAQRLDLLRGLMDTDGTVGHVGKETCEYSSKLERLARQVAELTRSLGYRVTVSRKAEARSRTGETWRVTFRADPDLVPFLLPRKADRVVTPIHVKNRAIVSIEPVESVSVRCIAVNTPDRLFRAGEGWTLTHNTRIAAAAGVPPIIVGLSEGLAAATYSNYGQAMRSFGALTMSSLWRNMAGSLETILPPPAGASLWYDIRGIPALKDDVKDAAEVQSAQAQSIKALTDSGFDPDGVIDAVTSGDLRRLKGQHSGLYSVQLQPPNPNGPPPAVQAGRALADLIAPYLNNGKS